MRAEEAIEIIKQNFPKTCRMVNGRYQGGFDDTECDFGKALLMAIEAIKEVQQYREIGTVEECREAVKKQEPKKPKEILRRRGGFESHHCPNCDTDYQTDNRYTITDGYCPACGKLLDSAFRHYCGNCGQAIDENLEGMEDD